MQGLTSVDVLVQDVRFGLRQLRRTPAFTIVAVLTLALGIGANTAIFSAMNAILLRYLPVPNPRQLVYLSTPATPAGSTQSGDGNTLLPERIFEELRAERQVLSDLVAFVPVDRERIAVRVGAVPEEVQVDMVSGNFFSGLGVPASRGRIFGMEDETAHAPVAVLSYEPVTPTAYLLYTQAPGGSTLYVELRTEGNPLASLPAVRNAVAEFGPDLAPLQPMTQEAQFEKSFAQERLFGRFAMFFGLLAMLLVATGLYGTLAYAVGRRTTEVGVRMALGAQRGQVLWMVLRGSLVVCLAAVVVGLPAAIAGVRFLRSMLFGVEPGDPVTFAAALGGILAVALLASLIPALRTASVDPMVALRHD